jgi:phytoene dehydrogenase-like protein
MENAVSDLAQALRERLALISDEESRRDTEAHMARLRAISEKIDKLQAGLPRPIDPQLAHYLQRRSYDKALEFLEQR